ncbi:MAG TPA: MBL fold metallo-hydrolase [Vicinamibacterales bacterium]|nr:MBL fold metallo-hydrolase [Vicinamibacterales bacterium]
MFPRRVILLLLVAAVLPRSALGQVDLSGEWASTFHEDLPHRGPMMLGDYTGLPLNEAGFRKAASWDEAARSLPERQCIPHVATYALRGPATIRLSKVTDAATGELIAYSLVGSYGRPRMIWMDGRPHPSPLAPHTWAGFSTGRWDRNSLVVTTTHIKAGWLNRNGSPTSDLATMVERFTRYGDYLLVTTIIKDPIFLAEPFIRTTNYVASPITSANAWGNCGPAQIVDELPGRPRGQVPHYLPEQRDHILAFVKKTGIPLEGARGGADTIYPEYAVKLRERTASAEHPPFVPPPRTLAREVGDLQVLPVQGSVYLLAGAGGNIAVQVGDDGVLLVDSGSGSAGDRVLAAIRRLTDRPIRFILNTSADLDHLGGNEALARAGRSPGGGRPSDSPGPGALIFAHEEVLLSMSAARGNPSPLPVAALPTEGYPGESKEVFFNGEAIQLLHQPAAHTAGDSIAFFRRSDVIATGDVFTTDGYPVIDVRRGGTLGGIIDALNRIIALAIPKDWQEGGTMIIPGHGRIADEADVVEYRDMVTIIRDRIEAMVRRGFTLEQVKAARPTFEYDARYGATSGPWTTEMFVEAAYRELRERIR